MDRVENVLIKHDLEKHFDYTIYGEDRLILNNDYYDFHTDISIKKDDDIWLILKKEYPEKEDGVKFYGLKMDEEFLNEFILEYSKVRFNQEAISDFIHKTIENNKKHIVYLSEMWSIN